MSNYYTSEKNVQILISLMKAHKIKKIIASPGSTNVAFVYSVQQDGYFEIYSAPDERSAAYIACGLAAESGEPVAISCTGATSSRNYMPGLTEAFYRKLPVLAITSTLSEYYIGHNKPQVIDRSSLPNDITKMSVSLPAIHNVQDEWACEINVNKALLALKQHGGGPVHINLTTMYSRDYSVKFLPAARVIDRITCNDEFPMLKGDKIAIFCGAHNKWSEELKKTVDCFCEKYNAIVLCDHTSNYKGEYRVLCPLITNRDDLEKDLLRDIDVIIHIGEISGAYVPLNKNTVKQVWRINPDGAICDPFQRLRYVFEMEEEEFFKKYVSLAFDDKREKVHIIEKWTEEYKRILENIPELPFSNAWIAQNTAMKLPENSALHLGILNSLRCWNFFDVPKSVLGYCNVGGFGIDGCISSLIGASLANPDKLFFGVVGDLAFFYDMNSIANHNVRSNIRILLINNGGGTEFKNYNHLAAGMGNKADDYIAALGHYGNKSSELVKNYSENLGFEYFGVSSKEEYLAVLPRFIQSEITDKPVIVEAFINHEDESNALKLINSANVSSRKLSDENNRREILKKPHRILDSDKKMKVIPWGAGNCFIKNSSMIKDMCNIEYVCDNNPDKWGKDIVEGVKCISPEELKGMKNVFVVIMIENINIAFQIANQLLDMQISSFDYISNWTQYMDEDIFE